MPIKNKELRLQTFGVVSQKLATLFCGFLMKSINYGTN